MTGEGFDEVSGRIKREIDEIIGHIPGPQLGFEMLEIYNHVLTILKERGTKYLLSDEVFSFKDTIIAWHAVLKELGTKANSDLLLGIVLATLYEKTKTT